MTREQMVRAIIDAYRDAYADMSATQQEGGQFPANAEQLAFDAALAALDTATPELTDAARTALSLLRTWADEEIEMLTKRFLAPHECRELTGARLRAFGEFRACIDEVASQVSARTVTP